jgi:hypothetical protein
MADGAGNTGVEGEGTIDLTEDDGEGTITVFLCCVCVATRARRDADVDEKAVCDWSKISPPYIRAIKTKPAATTAVATGCLLLCYLYNNNTL